MVSEVAQREELARGPGCRSQPMEVGNKRSRDLECVSARLAKGYW